MDKKKITDFFLDRVHWLNWTAFALVGWALVLYAALVAGVLWDWFLTPAGHELPTFRERVGVFLLITLALTETRSALSPENRTPPAARAMGTMAGTTVGITAALVGGAFLNWILPA